MSIQPNCKAKILFQKPQKIIWPFRNRMKKILIFCCEVSLRPVTILTSPLPEPLHTLKVLVLYFYLTTTTTLRACSTGRLERSTSRIDFSLMRHVRASPFPTQLLFSRIGTWSGQAQKSTALFKLIISRSRAASYHKTAVADCHAP